MDLKLIFFKMSCKIIISKQIVLKVDEVADNTPMSPAATDLS